MWGSGGGGGGGGVQALYRTHLRMVMAASVANLRLLILLTAGSSTPAFLLSRTTPFTRSSPTLERHATRPLRVNKGDK